MKWINDREPGSPGMYAIRCLPTNDVKSFSFAYFNGIGWILPSESGDDIAPYRGNPEWSMIDWGKDETAETETL